MDSDGPDYPVIRLSHAEWNALLEYSASYPTGVYPGKRWKRHDGAHDRAFIARGGKPRWLVGEYVVVASDASMCRIKWYRPIIRVRARRG